MGSFKKKQRNICVSIKRKNIRNHFSRLAEGNSWEAGISGVQLNHF